MPAQSIVGLTVTKHNVWGINLEILVLNCSAVVIFAVVQTCNLSCPLKFESSTGKNTNLAGFCEKVPLIIKNTRFTTLFVTPANRVMSQTERAKRVAEALCCVCDTCGCAVVISCDSCHVSSSQYSLSVSWGFRVRVPAYSLFASVL